MRIKNHTASQCWLRMKEQGKAKLKRAGRSRDFKRSPRESLRKVQSRTPARGRGAIVVLLCVWLQEASCFEFPDRAHTDDTEKKKSSKKRVTFETGKYSKKQNTVID